MRTLLLGCMGPALALLVAGCFPGSIPQARLGDRVWQDANANGLQDQGEPGKEGVDVALHKEDGELVAATLTDELGFYAFDQLRSGRYYLRFVVPEGWTITEKDAGDDELDSDVDPQSGQTEVFSFDSHTSDLTWDLGLLAAESEASGTAIAELVPTVEATSTPHPLAEYRQDEALQASRIVLISMEPDESGVLRASGSVLSSELPEDSQLADRLLVIFVDPQGNISVGWIGISAQASLNATGYPPGSVYPNWEFTRTLSPDDAAPTYAQEQVGPGDPGTCFGESFALASTGTTAQEIGELDRISFWGYQKNDDGTFAYVHHLLDGTDFETTVAMLFGEEVILETPGGVLVIGMPASGFFDPDTFSQSAQGISAVESHFGEFDQNGQTWLDYGECLQSLAYAQ